MPSCCFAYSKPVPFLPFLLLLPSLLLELVTVHAILPSHCLTVFVFGPQHTSAYFKFMEVVPVSHPPPPTPLTFQTSNI